MEEPAGVEGVYQRIAASIRSGYVKEENRIVTKEGELTFKPAEFGFDVTLNATYLGNTSDDFFLVYLSELYAYGDEAALDRITSLLSEKRTLQALELQRSVRRENHSYLVGKRRVSYSATYFSCTCPDWKYRRKLGGCKHIAAIRLLQV